MHTPYQILQLKQKQRKKIISQSKRQRSFSVRYEKNSQNTTQYQLQKGKTLKDIKNKYKHNDQTKSNNDTNHKKNNKDKKYQIVFRQSIRKVNAYRKKVYHNHSAIRNEKFINKYINTEQKQQQNFHTNGLSLFQPKQLQIRNFIQENDAGLSPRNKGFFTAEKSKRPNTEQKVQTMSVGKYKIIITPKGDKYLINQILPSQILSVQQCKINSQLPESLINQNKLKIQKAIQSLYNHSKHMQNSYQQGTNYTAIINPFVIRKGSLDNHYISFRENYSEQQNRKISNTIGRLNNGRALSINNKTNSNLSNSQLSSQQSPQKDFLQEIVQVPTPRSTTELKNKIKFLNLSKKLEPQGYETLNSLEKQKKQTLINSSYGSITQNIDDTKVANFIRAKKKKRIPLTLLKTKPKIPIDNFQYHRTITDNVTNGFCSRKNNFLDSIQKSYYSPKKKNNNFIASNRTKIKFNSIQDRLTGWENQTIDPQTLQNDQTIKQLLLSSAY